MISLKFPGKFGPIEVYKVRQAVKTQCQEAGLSADHTYGFVSAVDELCCNIMEHAKAEWFEIRIGKQDGMLEAILTDNGVAFDPTRFIKNQDNKQVFENATDRRLGLSMVGLLVDGISHSRDGEGVNRVVLTKGLGLKKPGKTSNRKP